MIHEKVWNQSQAIPCNTIVKFNEEIEGRDEDIEAVEGHFQTAAQRTRASSSCPEEVDDDVAGSVEPAKSAQNLTFPRCFSILTPFHTGSHDKTYGSRN